MIDLHCHILPALDDGPADLSVALEMANTAALAGTRILAATPHLREDYPDVDVAELADRCLELDRSIADSAIPIRIVPAGEIDLMWAVEASPEQLRLASYRQAGTHILVETPRESLLPNFETLLFRLRARGFRVLLAHPERSRTFQEQPERLATLAASGVLIQVNAGSLTRSAPGSRSRALARSLVRNRLAHVIASDAHAARGHRPPGLSDALHAARQLDPAHAESMVSSSPQAILGGDEPARPEGARGARGSSLRRRLSSRRARRVAS